MSKNYELLSLNADYYQQIKLLANKVIFLPKISWDKTADEMIIDGLKSKKWIAIGFVDYDSKKIASYLDYKIRDDTIEIGFCMTDPEYQLQKLMSKLFDYLIFQKYKNYNFKIGTYEGNNSMIAVINKYNFKLEEKKKDRIDGRNTLWYFLLKKS
jgi:RimJ/RimL family protein N-acetyltransferase